MQLFDTKSLRLKLFEEVHALAAKTQLLLTCSSNLKLAFTKTPSSLSPLTRSIWGKGSGIERSEGWGGEKQALLFS